MAGKVEKNSKLVIGLLGLVVLAIFVIKTFSSKDYSSTIFTFTGIALGSILLIEGGITTYFSKGKYKDITLKDFLVWITFVAGAIVIINTIFVYQTISNTFPENVVSFFGTVAGGVGILAGILLIIHMITPRMS